MIETITVVRKLKSGLVKGHRQYVWRGKHGWFRSYLTPWQIFYMVSLLLFAIICIYIGMSVREPEVISPLP